MAASIPYDQLVAKTLKILNLLRLKPQQEEILKASWEGRDCMAVLPTGFGKSLPYQMLTTMYKLAGIDGKVIVCSPLQSLIEDQVHRLRQIPNISAFYIGESPEAEKEYEHGRFDYLFGSSETLVGSDKWRKILKNFSVNNIIVDECTVISWGEEKKGEAFRKWFSCLGELRALFPSASVTALSATCRKADYKKTMKSLNMKSDTVVVKLSPNKPNIKLVVIKVQSIESGFLPVVEAVQEKKISNTLIYCSSIKDVSLIYNFLHEEITETDIVIEMFHSETEEKNKLEIIEKIRSGNCQYIVIATSALGMGIDIRNCYNVIVYGAPYSIVDLWQQIGRVGRDGSQAVAIFLYRGYQLKSTDEDVRNMYRNSTCRRLIALQPFISKNELSHVKSQTGVHTCCDVCMKQCMCNNCEFSPMECIFRDFTICRDISSSSSSSSTISYDLNLSDLEGEPSGDLDGELNAQET